MLERCPLFARKSMRENQIKKKKNIFRHIEQKMEVDKLCHFKIGGWVHSTNKGNEDKQIKDKGNLNNI
jgi:hypothetical protein